MSTASPDSSADHPTPNSMTAAASPGDATIGGKAAGKRGRKQDNSLPPSRARDVQRAFRARRAGQLSSLEARVAALEQENAELKQELEHYKSGGERLVSTPNDVPAPSPSSSSIVASIARSASTSTTPTSSASTGGSRASKRAKSSRTTTFSTTDDSVISIKTEDIVSPPASPVLSPPRVPSADRPSTQHRPLPPIYLPHPSEWTVPPPQYAHGQYALPGFPTSLPPSFSSGSAWIPLGAPNLSAPPPALHGQALPFPPPTSRPEPCESSPVDSTSSAASVLVQWSQQAAQASCTTPKTSCCGPRTPPSADLTSKELCGPSANSDCCPPPPRTESTSSFSGRLDSSNDAAEAAKALARARAPRPPPSLEGERAVGGGGPASLKGVVFNPDLCCGGLIDCSDSIFEENDPSPRPSTTSS